MNYTVTYKPSALAMLADLWNNAADRNAVAQAANAIDRLLGRDPLGVGESRSGPFRVLFEPPLGVHYRVSEDDRLVEVLKVWLVPPP
jgi:hypothetical protein